MNIPTTSIPSEGQTYTWNQEADLKGLEDICLLDQTSITVTVIPFDKGFDVHGNIKTLTPLDCSYCTNSLNMPIEEAFHEMVMNQKPNSPKEAKGEIVVEHDDLEVSYVENNKINLLPLLRELIQLNQPIQPKCQEKGGGPDAPKCVADWDYQNYFEESSNPLSPFSALKNVKVEKKVDKKSEKGQFTKSKKN